MSGGFRHAMAQVTFSLGRQDGSVPKVQLLPVFCRRIRADTELHRADIGVEGLRQSVPQHAVCQPGGTGLAQRRDQAGFYLPGPGFFGDNNNTCLVHR